MYDRLENSLALWLSRYRLRFLASIMTPELYEIEGEGEKGGGGGEGGGGERAFSHEYVSS